ncbi:hypothetical protein B4U80_14046 [Leptotrombidium deliense]|uniref:Endonuclease/exonuclease/phosphatase domain-containing protein n=1 Tax=Leptotrombidium deliense TaxID=299467 RepID=A0A443S4D9_9ACAR|nr:hypothetical protein B4U80_14046 [Leptotrombidium deliense]
MSLTEEKLGALSQKLSEYFNRIQTGYQSRDKLISMKNEIFEIISDTFEIEITAVTQDSENEEIQNRNTLDNDPTSTGAENYTSSQQQSRENYDEDKCKLDFIITQIAAINAKVNDIEKKPSAKLCSKFSYQPSTNAKYLKCFYANSRVAEENIDFLFLCETWLSPQYSSINILPNYSILRRDRNDGYGGVLIAFKKHLNVVEVSFNSDIEHLAVKLLINNRYITFVCIYLPPPVNDNTLLNLKTLLNDVMTSLKHNDEIICLGDFNVNILNHTNFTGKFSDIFSALALKQIIQFTTCPQYSEFGSLIDHVYCMNKDIVLSSNPTVNLTNSCDHKAISLTLNVRKTVNQKLTDKYLFQFTDDDYCQISDKINQVDWNAFFDTYLNVDQCYEKLSNFFTELLAKYKVKFNYKTACKFPKHIRKLILKKRLYRRQFLKTDNDAYLIKYRDIDNTISRCIIDHNSKKFNNLISKYDMKGLYKYIKKIRQKSLKHLLLIFLKIILHQTIN